MQVASAVVHAKLGQIPAVYVGKVSDNTVDLDLIGEVHRSAWSRRAGIAPMVTAERVAELKRIYAEGLAADVGTMNPYYGQMVNAAVWRGGYRRMLDDKLANSPARQQWLARYN